MTDRPVARLSSTPQAILLAVPLAILVIALFYLLFFPVAKSLALDAYNGPDPEIFAEAVASARTLIATFLTAAAALAGIYFTWSSQNRTRSESLRSQEFSTETLKLSRDTRASENFIRAVDQLGSENAGTRVGGILGLGRLLRTAKPEGDYWPIMDVLNSFVRNWSRDADRDKGDSEPPEDIAAALRVLARKDMPKAPEREGVAPVDLHDCYLHRAFLSHAQFQTAYLDHVDLTRATMRHADLFRAWLKNALMCRAILENASLVEADLERADLNRAELHGANLTGARNVTQEQIDQALGNDKTTLPDGISRPAHWV